MSNFGLLSNLEEDSKNPKTKFQIYEIEMGFEKVEIAIPFSVCEQFETMVNEIKPKSRVSLSEVVRKFNGTIE